MAKAKKKALTEAQKAEQRKRHAEVQRKSREKALKEQKRHEKVMYNKRKHARKKTLEKRNAIWEAYMRDCYGK